MADIITGKVSLKTLGRLKNQESQGFIHSIFEHTVNIVLNKQIPNMVTLGGRRVRGSPNSIFLENFQELKTHFHQGKVVYLSQGKLTIDDQLEIELHVDSVQIYKNQTVYPPQLDQKIKELNKIMTENNPYQDNQVYSPFLVPLLREIKALKQALISEDHAAIRKYGERLIGLGVGLTPSGDDVLTGLFLTLNSWEKSKKEICEQILGRNSTQLRQTNLISQHQLYFAALGEGKESVLSFIRESDSELIAARGRLVLAIGSTSGFDTLLGIKLAMEFIAAQEIDKIEMEKN